jgi:predicted peptidase
VVATVAIVAVSEAGASAPPQSSATETGGFAARYAGETDSPLAYYEYLPASYGNGDASPLLVFLHGLDASGDGSEAELGSVLADGIPNLLEMGQWPSERPFVVLAAAPVAGG